MSRLEYTWARHLPWSHPLLSYGLWARATDITTENALSADKITYMLCFRKAIWCFLRKDSLLDLLYINLNLLSFFQLDVVDRLILFGINQIFEIFVDAKIYCNFEVEIFLSVDIADTIAKLGFAYVTLFSECLSLPLYLYISVLF